MGRSFALAALFIAASTSFAQTAATHSLEMAFTYDSMKIQVTSTVKSEPVGTDDSGTVSFKGSWTDLKILVDVTPFPAPSSSTVEYAVTGTGELFQVKGGVPGVDMPRTMLLFIFIPPTDGLVEGSTYTRSFSNAEGRVPAMEWSATVGAAEEIAGQKVTKVTASLKETGRAFSAESVFWVRGDGTVVKLESSFKGLPVPQIGSTVDGTLKANLAE